MEILYKTIHGSRLYGLDHKDSDYDWYTVVRNPRKTSQKIAGDQDNTVVDFGTFIRHAQSGAPQALEAMFSTRAEIDHIADFRHAYQAGRNYRIYRNIIKRMAITPKWDDLKHKRHIIRLAYNVTDLQRYNRFNPRVSYGDRQTLDEVAQEDMSTVYRLAQDMMSVLD